MTYRNMNFEHHFRGKGGSSSFEYRGWRRRRRREPCNTHKLFCVAKRKKGKQRKRRNSFKAEIIKRLSPR